MCMGKVVIRCPKCKRTIQVTRPDSSHPFWSLDKPREDEGIVNVLEQPLQCVNKACGSTFSVYWYEK